MVLPLLLLLGLDSVTTAAAGDLCAWVKVAVLLLLPRIKLVLHNL